MVPTIVRLQKEMAMCVSQPVAGCKSIDFVNNDLFHWNVILNGQVCVIISDPFDQQYANILY